MQGHLDDLALYILYKNTGNQHKVMNMDNNQLGNMETRATLGPKQLTLLTWVKG